VPFDDPGDPVPARVVTTPVEITILRIGVLGESVAFRFVRSVVIHTGRLKLAAVPVPFDDQLAPVPARVVTTPVEITILRIR